MNRGRSFPSMPRMEPGEPDGRPSDQSRSGSEFIIPADTMAIANWLRSGPLLPETSGLRSTARRLYQVDFRPDSRPGVFAGGDNVNGADLVVTALADGRAAAKAGILASPGALHRGSGKAAPARRAESTYGLQLTLSGRLKRWTFFVERQRTIHEQPPVLNAFLFPSAEQTELGRESSNRRYCYACYRRQASGAAGNLRVRSADGDFARRCAT